MAKWQRGYASAQKKFDAYVAALPIDNQLEAA